MALRLLVAREHSCLELTRKLSARGLTPDAIAGALDRLISEGALDESRLAAHYVAERADKGFGPQRIRAELRDKGLADSLIDRHLQPMNDTWPEVLARAHERRFGQRSPSDRADYAKRARFLEQRGFTPDSIRRFLRYPD
ncbi:RecX family transcriptional regulator [Allochromatium palmeri]|uniref:Regulatory protein RecX n=1 Tax=Allochromatium palmeri TaxID=231048 RepID=A0A6N8EH07_9GAMM|nr:regulatory protein RecX [Allochromatium palmeri]